MTDEELEAAIAPYEEELEKLEAREYELEKKAGWYGDLTDEEISQLESLYDQVDAILEKAIGDNEDMTEDEIMSALTQYQDELGSLEKQIDEIEHKAGFGGLADDHHPEGRPDGVHNGKPDGKPGNKGNESNG